MAIILLAVLAMLAVAALAVGDPILEQASSTPTENQGGGEVSPLANASGAPK